MEALKDKANWLDSLVSFFKELAALLTRRKEIHIASLDSQHSQKYILPLKLNYDEDKVMQNEIQNLGLTVPKNQV